MDTIQAIMQRRSIRKYKDQPLPEKSIETILKAAMQAPSAGDGRPWHFVVIQKPELLKALAKNIDDDNSMFKQAKAAIMIVGDEQKEKFPGFYPQDCACAGQNIYLAAHELGLGTVWIALWNVTPRVNGIKKIVNVPDNLMPFAIFPIGVPDEKLGLEDRYDESLVHYDVW